MAKLCDRCVRPMGRLAEGGWYCPACSSRFLDGEPAEPDEPEGTIGEPDGDARVIELSLRPDWKRVVGLHVETAAEALEGGASMEEAIEAAADAVAELVDGEEAV